MKTQPEYTGPKLSSVERQLQLNKIHSWHIKGKFGFKNGNEGGSASLDWQQQHNNYFIRVYGPLNMDSMTVTGRPGEVRLTNSDGELRIARTPEQLIHQQVGWTLPISGLNYWVRGIPAPYPAPKQVEFNADGELASLEQDGWQIEYQAYSDHRPLSYPYKMTLKQDKIRLKLIFRNWEVEN